MLLSAKYIKEKFICICIVKQVKNLELHTIKTPKHCLFIFFHGLWNVENIWKNRFSKFISAIKPLIYSALQLGPLKGKCIRSFLRDKQIYRWLHSNKFINVNQKANYWVWNDVKETDILNNKTIKKILKFSALVPWIV